MMSAHNRTPSGRCGATSSETILLVIGVAVVLILGVTVFGGRLTDLGQKSTAALDGKESAGTGAESSGTPSLGAADAPSGSGGVPARTAPVAKSGDTADNPTGGPTGAILGESGATGPAPKKDLVRRNPRKGDGPGFAPLRTADELVDPETGLAALPGGDGKADSLVGGLLDAAPGTGKPRKPSEQPTLGAIEDRLGEIRETLPIAEQDARQLGVARDVLGALLESAPADGVAVRREDLAGIGSPSRPEALPESLANLGAGVDQARRALEGALAAKPDGLTRADLERVQADLTARLRGNLESARALAAEREGLLTDRERRIASAEAFPEQIRELDEILNNPRSPDGSVLSPEDLAEAQAQRDQLQRILDDPRVAEVIERQKRRGRLAEADREFQTKSLVPSLAADLDAAARAGKDDPRAALFQLVGSARALADENGRLNDSERNRLALGERTILNDIEGLLPGPERAALAARALVELASAATSESGLNADTERPDLRIKASRLLALEGEGILAQFAQDSSLPDAKKAEDLASILELVLDPADGAAGVRGPTDAQVERNLRLFFAQNLAVLDDVPDGAALERIREQDRANGNTAGQDAVRSQLQNIGVAAGAFVEANRRIVEKGKIREKEALERIESLKDLALVVVPDAVAKGLKVLPKEDVLRKLTELADAVSKDLVKDAFPVDIPGKQELTERAEKGLRALGQAAVDRATRSISPTTEAKENVAKLVADAEGREAFLRDLLDNQFGLGGEGKDALRAEVRTGFGTSRDASGIGRDRADAANLKE